jgi:hypothetical protein
MWPNRCAKMNPLRALSVALAAALAVACSSPSPQQRTTDAEIAAMAPLKSRYSGLVMGFDVRPPATLLVSLDLQQYIETGDDTIAAMKRDALARWRSAWIAAHPHSHAELRVRFIDFIGRKVGEESTQV